MDTQNTLLDVVVIGAGQAALTTAYFLKRTGLSFVLLDTEQGPGVASRMELIAAVLTVCLEFNRRLADATGD